VDEIVKKIRILVGEGVNNVREMGRHIRQYVKNELFLGQELPPCTNRRFHPKQVDIRNHMYLATIESRFSKFDQENMSAKTGDWEKKYAKDNFLYRPYQEGCITVRTTSAAEDKKENNVNDKSEKVNDDNAKRENEDEAKEGNDDQGKEEDDMAIGLQEHVNLEKSLLFVHQSAWQRRLLLKYGNDLCLLDATYKTTRFAVPLFSSLSKQMSTTRLLVRL
jgi:hypothetical protein